MYYTYITTNPQRTTFYTGTTNDLKFRVRTHEEIKGNPETFAGKYYCYKLVFFETFDKPSEAIRREKNKKTYPR